MCFILIPECVLGEDRMYIFAPLDSILAEVGAGLIPRIHSACLKYTISL